MDRDLFAFSASTVYEGLARDCEEQHGSYCSEAS